VKEPLREAPPAGGNVFWAERFKNCSLPNYQPAPLAIESGEGCEVIDVEGNRYLDMVAGIAVNALGHRHPKIVAALKAQAERVLHTSNLYVNTPSVELAELLIETSFAECVFFSNSGAEANEAAIKLARRSAFDKGEAARTKILSFDQSFHGRTLGALAATGQPKYHQGFGPMPADFVHLPYGDTSASAAAIDERTAAVIVEAVQGEGGVRVAPPGFISALREQTKAKGACLILDEVQVGIGRTGKMFCYQHEAWVPDIVTLAKGVGGGLPLGAMLTTRELAKAFSYGTHGTTFGGNPMACAAGLAVLRVIREPGFLDRVIAVSEHLFAGLFALQTKHPRIVEVRGRGLMIGIELVASLKASDVVRACRERGVLVHVAGPNVLRLLPPLIVEASHVDRAVATLDAALASLP
jgi:acetylornithine/N-succinyldiaminopimelate aminotransferase